MSDYYSYPGTFVPGYFIGWESPSSFGLIKTPNYLVQDYENYPSLERKMELQRYRKGNNEFRALAHL